MITLLEDLPDDVLGVEVAGEITSDDYKQTLLPALERHREEYGEGALALRAR